MTRSSPRRRLARRAAVLGAALALAAPASLTQMVLAPAALADDGASGHGDWEMQERHGGHNSHDHGGQGHDMTMTPGNSRFVHGGYPGNDSAEGTVKKRRVDYTVPAVTLRNRRGEAVALRDVLSGERPVVMQFVFTTCATICPVLSASLAQAKDGLLDAHPETRLVSVSIDPEHDTPARLRDYAAKHDAGAEWTFLTGRLADVDRVIRAFDALFEANNKMYHEPYTYMRPRGAASWVRLNGLMSAGEMVAEYRSVLAADGQKAALR